MSQRHETRRRLHLDDVLFSASALLLLGLPAVVAAHQWVG